MDSKTRATLRGLATKIDPVFQVGRDGVTENVVVAVDLALTARELVKVNVLKNCELSPKEVLEELSNKTNSTGVCSIGQKIVLYRVSNKKGIKHVLEI